MVYLKDSKLKIQGAGDVAKVFLDLLALEDRIERDKEHFYVMQLDVRSQIKMVEVASIIIAHNHPSGESDPSEEDTQITKQIFEAGQVLGITMLDHIIFTNTDYYSFRNNGKGWEL